MKKLIFLFTACDRWISINFVGFFFCSQLVDGSEKCNEKWQLGEKLCVTTCNAFLMVCIYLERLSDDVEVTCNVFLTVYNLRGTSF